ncbi:MAG: hypothetical protein EBY16_10980, partial [Gammaproteobacteria bacterium]|nr:hypothetical protein [Gammaproteobacteria bacterium]
MSDLSNSNDASDLFWPGYVDAVTNLAINLLFVIAVMSIVVLSSILQISKMKPDLNIKDIDAVKSVPVSSKDEEKNSNKNNNTSQSTSDSQNTESAKIKKLEEDKLVVEKKLVLQTEQITKLEKEINQLKSGQSLQKSVKGKKDQPGGTADQDSPAEIVNANEIKQSLNAGENQLLSLSAGGLLVVFEKDVINLSDKEAVELVKKLTESHSLKNTNWQIRVNVPKG